MLGNLICFSLVLFIIQPSSLELIVNSVEELDSDMIAREASLLESFEKETECETRKDVHEIYEVIVIEENKKIKTNITLGNTFYFILVVN